MHDDNLNNCMTTIACVASEYTTRLPKSVDKDELVAEGYLGIVESMAQHDPSRGATLLSYCFIRSKGRMIHHVKTECRYSEFLTGFRLELLPSEDILPEDSVICKELIQQLHTAVESLPKLQQKTVRSILSGFTIVELAKKWGVTTRRINSLYKRAVTSLQETLLEA